MLVVTLYTKSGLEDAWGLCWPCFPLVHAAPLPTCARRSGAAAARSRKHAKPLDALSTDCTVRITGTPRHLFEPQLGTVGVRHKTQATTAPSKREREVLRVELLITYSANLRLFLRKEQHQSSTSYSLVWSYEEIAMTIPRSIYSHMLLIPHIITPCSVLGTSSAASVSRPPFRGAS